LVAREPFARQKQNVVGAPKIAASPAPTEQNDGIHHQDSGRTGGGRAMWVIFGRALVYTHRWPLVGQPVVGLCGQAATLAVAAALSWLAMTSFAATASLVEANNTSDEFSALRDYVQALTTDHKTVGSYDQRSTNLAQKAPAHSVERIGLDQPESIKALPKLSEADNLIDALREFLQKGFAPQSAPPATTPNGPIAGGTQQGAPVTATYVGAQVCTSCHATEAELFGHTLMGRIAKTQKGKLDCESCHGPGSAHVKAGGGLGVGGIISFRPEDRSRTAEENNTICLACHERGDRTNWPGSIHETRGLMCTNCHTIMKQVSRKSQLSTPFEPDTCFQCHKDRRAHIFFSAHEPLREGKMVCSACHNPHGSFTEALLKKNSINDTCYTCHAQMRGPFLFEHLPVRENCDNCHDPHGSVNEFSLKMSRPRLCFECHQGGHSSTAGINSSLTMSRSCQNCHTQVHGSNSPAGGALQR
jgi:DmsE family decaheme c-type cytochrome